jgi:hypothetical protein
MRNALSHDHRNGTLHGRRHHASRPVLERFEDRTLLSTFSVTNLFDAGVGSLRWAIGQANTQPGDDTIDFSVNGTLDLNTALPNLSSNIQITGPGASSLTVERASSAPSFCIFDVSSGATVGLSGLTMAKGQGEYGGGISLTLTDCRYRRVERQMCFTKPRISPELSGSGQYGEGRGTLSDTYLQSVRVSVFAIQSGGSFGP